VRLLIAVIMSRCGKKVDYLGMWADLGKCLSKAALRVLERGMAAVLVGGEGMAISLKDDT
jgi:hypothetical protein